MFLSIARIYRQNLDLLESLGRIDTLFAASEAFRDGRAPQAVAAVDQALDEARVIR